MPRNQKFVMSMVWTVLACTGISAGQSWSGVLAPNRAIDWSTAGATIVNRTTICATLNPGATVAQINTQIAACNNGVVLLTAGTYSGLAGQIVFNNKSNVTLRGAGADQTFLVWSSRGACNGLGADICIINGASNDRDNPGNVATWTAGYAKGATSITLTTVSQGSINNLHVGSQLVLDQLDPTSDTGNIWTCQTVGTCSTQGSNTGRAGRNQTQQVKVTSISGTGPWTIGITPGLYAPNWASARTPNVWWSSSLPATGDGIENLSLNHSAVGSGSGIMMANGYGNWVSGVRSLNAIGGVSAHVFFYLASHNTIQNSYFYGSSGSSEGYGIDSGFGSSDNLVQNNICQHVSSCQITENSTGSVFAYNYAVDNFYGTDPNPVNNDWEQEDSDHHAVGDGFELFEGNEGTGAEGDSIHGSSYMWTYFRNRYNGLDTATNNGIKTLQTVPIQILFLSRYWNLVGNVFGTSGYHTNYLCAPTGTTDNCALNGNKVIYDVGFSGNHGTHCANCDNGQTLPNDTLLQSTTMLWGNYDTVNTAVRFNTTEDGHLAPIYPAITNASQTLPASFYLSSKPSFWGTMPWPAVGPDVTGGNVGNVGGHVYHHPAANCYLTIMGGKTDGSSGALAFNADNCYSGAGDPAPPADLQATPH